MCNKKHSTFRRLCPKRMLCSWGLQCPQQSMVKSEWWWVLFTFLHSSSELNLIIIITTAITGAHEGQPGSWQQTLGTLFLPYVVGPSQWVSEVGTGFPISHGRGGNRRRERVSNFNHAYTVYNLENTGIKLKFTDPGALLLNYFPASNYSLVFFQLHVLGQVTRSQSL